MKSGYFDGLVVCQIADLFTQSRREVKGARLNHLLPIFLVGKSGGLRLKEAVMVSGIRKDNLYKRLQRVIKAGFIYKNGFDYYLTSSGRIVYNKLDERLKPAFDKIRREIINSLAARGMLK